MIDELDTFNATVMLALARAARLPGQVSPVLASQVANLAQLKVLDYRVEEDASHTIFGYHLKDQELFTLYRKFWVRFPVSLEPVETRVTINAPAHAIIRTLKTSGRLLPVVTDPRLGFTPQKLPEAWALPPVDDVVLFSENGWTVAAQQLLAAHLHTGTTITLVRPGERCNWWFDECGIQHNFDSFLAEINLRAELDTLHASSPVEPHMLTIFGVKAIKLTV